MRIQKNILLLLLLITVVSGRGFSQINLEESEEINFSIPKSIFFGGEKIWIKATVVQNEIPVQSKVLYAELLNRDNESVALAKMPLQEGEAFNYLLIPDNLPSDNYLLRVFTRISPYQNLETGLVQQFVTVFNRQVPPEVVPERQVIDKGETPSSAVFTLSSRQLAKGENLTIDLSDQGSVEEVKVGFWNPFLEDQDIIPSSEIYESLESRDVVPELFGHIIEAEIENSEIDTTQLYYLSVHGEKSALFTDRPDANGRIFIDAGGIRNWNYMVAQSDGNKSLLDFYIVSPAPVTQFQSDFTIPELKISPEDQPFLQELLKGGQVEGYFVQSFEANNLPVVTGFVEDIAYQLDDYTRFENVETVIKEYVPEVSVKNIQKKKEFRVINSLRTYAFDENPLMLVDAMPVFDSDQLAKFDPKEFKSLEILTRQFYLNEEELSGVISFSSYNNDFGGYPIPSNGIYLDYQGILPTIESSEELFDGPKSTDKIMDWRTVLYWSVTQGDQEIPSKISLKIPDLAGFYQVSIKSNGQIYQSIVEVN